MALLVSSRLPRATRFGSDRGEAMTNLEALLERVRAATAASQQLDIDILQAINWTREAGHWRDPDGRYQGYILPNPTSSLDAIVGLIERKLPGWSWQIYSGDGYYSRDPLATLLPPPMRGGAFSFQLTGKTSCLALCIAFLEALLAQEKQEGGGG